jgi:hypothetical protein
MVGRNLRYSIFSILIMLVLTLALSPGIPPSISTSKSPYESGYDHGCDDADISDPDDRYINQPEKGPSFHTNEFMRGYNDGYDECSGSGESNDPESNEPNGNLEDNNGQPPSGGRINWEQLCMRFGDRIDISPDECSRYAQGTQLTQEGEDFLVCNLVARVGPTLLAAAIGGLGGLGVGGVGGFLAELC